MGSHGRHYMLKIPGQHVVVLLLEVNLRQGKVLGSGEI
jgi:hypothetical protein